MEMCCRFTLDGPALGPWVYSQAPDKPSGCRPRCEYTLMAILGLPTLWEKAGGVLRVVRKNTQHFLLETV
jgi:hypothetical protein